MKNGFLGVALVLTTILANAQNNPNMSQAEASRQLRETQSTMNNLGVGDGVPSLYSEEEQDIGPQTVLRKRQHKWLRVSLDGEVYYTDNMLFRNGGEVDAGVAVTTAEAALRTPPCITRWASYRAEVGYRHQFFNYFGTDDDVVTYPGRRREDFDFDSSTAFADVLAQTAHYQFRAGFDYMRLLGFEPLQNNDYEEFYREYVPRWSVQRNFRVCDWSQLSFAYLGSYHFSEEDAVLFYTPGFGLRSGLEDRNERWEHAALAAYSIALPWHLVLQPYYRFQFTDYLNFDFSEKLHTTGIGLGWYPCESFGARLFANYNWNDSDNYFRRYEQWNAGGGLNVTLRF